MKLLLVALLSSAATAALVSLKLDTSSGAYSVSTEYVDFMGLDYVIQMNKTTFCSCDGSLILEGHSAINGSDGMGSYTANTLNWTLKGTTSTYGTTFRLYEDAIAFQQDFPEGVMGASGANFVAEFPALGWSPTNTPAGYVTWNSGMSGDHIMAGPWPSKDGQFGARDGGPVVIFPKDQSEQWTVVVSEASRFMAGGVGPCIGKNQSLCSGLRGSYDTIPPAFSFETIMSVSSERGVANGMYEWGSKLLSKYSKQRTMPWEATSDYITKLGYSSTGWFHYCPNPVNGKYDADHGNYEDPLVNTHKILDQQGIPVHYGWIDSWWYGERLHGGVALWEDITTNPPDFSDMNQRFPTGLTGMNQKTGRKVVAHIGEWRNTSPYEKNASNGFVDRGSHTLPTSHSFWQELMGKAKDWGLLVMKQDHINENIQGYDNNVTVLADWLAAQAQGSYDHGIPIMYCMDQPWFLTNALQLPLKGHANREVITRASGDYLPGDNTGQWSVGKTSILSWSISVFPYKDTFYTNTSEHNAQKGCPFYGFKEEYPKTHAIAAVLSAGPVAFSDGPGSTNKSLVMQTCRTDGTLLKPDKPAMAIERTWDRMAFNNTGPQGEVWATSVSIRDCHEAKSHSWHYVFANKLAQDFSLGLSDLHYPADGTFVAWEYDTTIATKMDANTPITLKAGKDYGDARFWRLSPMMTSGLSIIGEPNKFVGIAKQRFSCLSQDSSQIQATLIGAPNEAVEIAVADENQTLHTAQCRLSAQGTAQLTVEVADVKIWCQ